MIPGKNEMLICKVTGQIVSTIKNEHLVGQKLLIIQPQNLKGEDDGPSLIAVDIVDAGIGDLVLVNKEGSGARVLLDNENIPDQAVIVGVIDGVEIFDDEEF